MHMYVWLAGWHSSLEQYTCLVDLLSILSVRYTGPFASLLPVNRLLAIRRL